MQVFVLKSLLQEQLKVFKTNNCSVGLVPTMGALHKGHLSLVELALQDCDKVVVSIFVNPTQFNNKKDLDTYPSTLDADLKLLEELDSSRICVYAPSVNDVYSNNVISQEFNFDGLEDEMEGAFRPGHFNGVGTVVKFLLEITEPNKAYFGKKDYQQLMIIKKLVEKEQINVEIVGCEILRENDGLAMSSRNVKLSVNQREQAPLIYKILNDVKLMYGDSTLEKIYKYVEDAFSNNDILELEYFIVSDANTLKPITDNFKPQHALRAFISVYAGEVRLIDNISLN